VQLESQPAGPAEEKREEVRRQRSIAAKEEKRKSIIAEAKNKSSLKGDNSSQPQLVIVPISMPEVGAVP